jgi:predicted DCC family thiol-disulfide oxidoreductase YuxK
MQIPEHVLLFDGVCNLCNGAVQFIIKHDKNSVIKFASLQSAAGQELLNKYHINSETFVTMIYIQNQVVYTESNAALRIASTLGCVWKTAVLLYIFPEFIRNAFYRMVSRNRYRIFGKRETCMIPSPEIVSRFLDV